LFQSRLKVDKSNDNKYMGKQVLNIWCSNRKTTNQKNEKTKSNKKMANENGICLKGDIANKTPKIIEAFRAISFRVFMEFRLFTAFLILTLIQTYFNLEAMGEFLIVKLFSFRLKRTINWLKRKVKMFS
jgi:hypothetical protein